MWSEELNNKIKQASENHIPEYDESAWVKMEELLNKEVSLKNASHKRLTYFLLLCFFIIGGTLLLNKEWSNKLSRQYAKTNLERAVIDDEKKLKPRENVFDSKNQKAEKKIDNVNQPNKKHGLPKSIGKNFRGRQLSQDASLVTNKTAKKILRKDYENNRRLALNDNELRPVTDENLKTQDKELIHSPVTSQEQIQHDSLNINNDSVKENGTSLPSVQLNNRTKNKNFLSRFSFSASVGTDVSGVKLKDAGKATISYGAGIGFKMSKRFSLRSGLYIADKIYSSTAEYYNPPAGYWTNYVDLKRVDADCKVYEIPLAVYFSFKEKNNHHWFAALGSSTYVMKKETYNYLYKTQAGNMLYGGWTLKDKNKHYFSMITLSGGYAYQINKTFSLMAEPYVKIPTAGIGFGKIKLKSTGVLFTLSATPF